MSFPRRSWAKLLSVVMGVAISDSVRERLRYVPALPVWLRPARYRLRYHGPRSELPPSVPVELETTPGVARDDDTEWEAFRRKPLRNFLIVYLKAEMWILRNWSFVLPAFPRFVRSGRRLREVATAKPRRAGAPRTPEQLSVLIRAESARLGLTAVGFAAYDPRYTYIEDQGSHDEGSVIICLLEEDYDDCQSAPSIRHERMLYELYTALSEMAAKLARHVLELGYRAQPHDVGGPFMYIPYAVQAGLGQLGYNGQLLTPSAGARVTITAITTNARLAHDQPVDFGIPGICAKGKVCVRRCPVGAIPHEPAPHRGVTKTKIKTERCLPVVGQAAGCSVCVKVCPIHRYGLDAVIAYHTETGQVLGKDGNHLEGYRWPIDDQFYRVGRKPRIDGKRLLKPRGLEFDPALLHRPFSEESVTGESRAFR